MESKPIVYDIIRDLEKPVDIEEIKNVIPLIKNLDSSWNHPDHIGWQILRLNKDYQKDVIAFYKNFHLWADLSFYGFLFADFPPCPKESFYDYTHRYVTDDKKKDYWTKSSMLCWQKILPLSDRIPLDQLWDLRKKIGTAIHYHPKDIGIIDFDYFVKHVHINLNRRIPFPYNVRFLCPWVDMYGTSIDMNYSLARGKGRPQNWLINLLIYELSEAGMKNMEIARLLFGVDSSTEYWPDETKHPVLVKIATIKRAIGKTISKAYPF